MLRLVALRSHRHSTRSRPPVLVHSGPLNWFSYNVGWHNEHHDFPFIPGSRLPQLRLIAPEFYDPLPYHGSWVDVLTSYVCTPTVGPHSRVKRNTLPKGDREWVLRGGAEETVE